MMCYIVFLFEMVDLAGNDILTTASIQYFTNAVMTVPSHDGRMLAHGSLSIH